MLVAWVMASVVIIAPGRKDRGADSERQSAFVVVLCRNSIVALVYMRVRVMVPMRVEARHHRLSAHLERHFWCVSMCVWGRVSWLRRCSLKLPRDLPSGGWLP